MMGNPMGDPHKIEPDAPLDLDDVFDVLENIGQKLDRLTEALAPLGELAELAPALMPRVRVLAKLARMRP
jgi:hypothetical protein